ncbi:malectin domain-containing carbohydrate-binding protein [Persicobacter diffluens]
MKSLKRRLSIRGGRSYEVPSELWEDIYSNTSLDKGTSIPQNVFLTERYGKSFAYHLPIKQAGFYEVSVWAAETFWLDISDYHGPWSEEEYIKRRFSIKIQGYPDQEGIVLSKSAERITATIYADRPINVKFYMGERGIDNAKVNAISWEKVTAPQYLYIDCGNLRGIPYAPYVDSVGIYSRLAMPDAYFQGGRIYDNENLNSFMGTERYGQDFSYRLPTSVGSQYRLRILSSETYFNSVGNRKFNVEIDQQKVLDHYMPPMRDDFEYGDAELPAFDFTAKYPLTTIRFYVPATGLNNANVNALLLERVDLNPLKEVARNIQELISISPNPAYLDYLIVKSETPIKQVWIINSTGNEIDFDFLMETSTQWRISDFASAPFGLYQVFVQTEKDLISKNILLGR